MKMGTYKQIQDWVKQKYGFVPKTCWIAHVKHISGISIRQAYNRQGEERVYPCPSEKIEPIRSAMKHFGMIE